MQLPAPIRAEQQADRALLGVGASFGAICYGLGGCGMACL